MSGWGGKRPGAGRKRKPREPEGEKSTFRNDFSERISLEADGPEGLTRRVVLALACRWASLSEIAAALGLSKNEVVNLFEEQLRNALAVARANAVNLINKKAEQGNVTAIIWLLRATDRAWREEEKRNRLS